MTKYGTTAKIGRRQAEGAFHAVRYANDNGRAFNLLITINFSDLGISPDEAGAFFRILRQRVTRWWTYERKKSRPFGAFDALAVHEHPEGGPRHVHWFVRAPEGARLELEAIVCNRLQKLTRLDCLGDAIDFTDVTHPGGMAKYVLKGVDPAFADYFHMDAIDQGEIIGRRIFVSRSVGRSARENAGWKRKRTKQIAF